MVQLLLAIIYLAFISLGLPDALLGSAWPSIYQEFNVPVSYMGIVSALISIDTVISSLMSDWMNRKLGAGKVTAISVAMTALALLGFSFSSSFWMLCILAIPYGLGAGGAGRRRIGNRRFPGSGHRGILCQFPACHSKPQ